MAHFNFCFYHYGEKPMKSKFETVIIANDLVTEVLFKFPCA
jgi:hypothetical protein